MKQFDEYSILENRNILPVHLLSRRPDNARIEPLRRLALAVLLDALRVFQSNIGRSRMNRREFDEAREWLLEACIEGPFSFENVCYLLDIDASRLRIWLRAQVKERARFAGTGHRTQAKFRDRSICRLSTSAGSRYSKPAILGSLTRQAATRPHV